MSEGFETPAHDATHPAETPEVSDEGRDVDTAERAQETDTLAALRKVRSEAAGLRRRLRDLEAQYHKIQSQYEEATVAADSASRQLMRIRAAISAGIPLDRLDYVAERLKGETPDELAEDAKRMAALLAPSGPVRDVSQGQGNTVMALNGNDLLDAVMRKLGM